MSPQELELAACSPEPVRIEHFNPAAQIPYGVTVNHICSAMNDFVSFLEIVNIRLNERENARLESFLMPANFSSIVGEFMTSNIPKYHQGIVKNTYHNGHPDMIPAGVYPNHSVQHGDQGIEVKSSRYLKGWQGHNAEQIWLMVFVFESNHATDGPRGVAPIPFRFLGVYGAQLEQSDWSEAPRREGSRRTATASVLQSGYQKMTQNWIYKAPNVALQNIQLGITEDD